MARTVGIGHQDFETVRMKNTFYIDKTSLIRKWWENEDAVTLIARPRRFGKTLNMSMLENFFLLNMQDGRSFLKDWMYGKMKNTENCRVNIRLFLSVLRA